VDDHSNGDGHWGLGSVVRNEDVSCLGAATKVVRAREAIKAETLGIEVVLNKGDGYRDGCKHGG
jgi:hypothetical protein